MHTVHVTHRQARYVFSFLISLSCLLVTTIGYVLQPTPLQPTVFGGTQQCPDVSQLLASLTQNITDLITQQVSANLSYILNLALSANCAADSCRAIAELRPAYRSGYYWIVNSTNAPTRVYCDLERVLNGSRGWMRVAYLNMTDPTQSCPPAWLLNNPTGTTIRLCGRSGNNVCFSTIFSTYGVSYAKVCGWMRGYSYNSNDGFFRYSYCTTSPCTIDQPYVDGVSVTHMYNGSTGSRQHLWTYTVGGGSSCPCYIGSASKFVNAKPAFVGSNWYCQGQQGGSTSTYYNYPLWGGSGPTCSGNLAPCCADANLPWFYRTLSATATSDIEVRICDDQTLADEDVQLQNLELYVF